MSTKDKNKKFPIINIVVVAVVLVAISFILHKVLGRSFFLMLLLFTVLYGAITFFVEVLNAFLKNKKEMSAKVKEDEEKKETVKKTSSTGWTSPVREDNVPKYESKPFRFDEDNKGRVQAETQDDEKPGDDRQPDVQYKPEREEKEYPSVKSSQESIADNPFSTSKHSANESVKPFERERRQEPERTEERKYVIPDVHFTFTTKKEEVKEEETAAAEDDIISDVRDEQPQYETVIDYPDENEEQPVKAEIPEEAPDEWTEEKDVSGENEQLNGRERLESVLETGSDIQYSYETIKNIDTIESETKDISESIRSALAGSSERKQIRFITVEHRDDKKDSEPAAPVVDRPVQEEKQIQNVPASVSEPAREPKTEAPRPASRPRLFDSEVEETTLVSNPYAGGLKDETKDRNEKQSSMSANDNRSDKVVADKSKLSRLFGGKNEQESPKEQKHSTFAGFTKQENVGTHDVRDEIDDEFSGKDFQIKPSPSKNPSYTSRVGQSAFQVKPSERVEKAPQKAPEYTAAEEKPAAASTSSDRPKPKRPKYKVPSLDILAEHKDVSRNPEKEEQSIRDNEEKLISSLASFGINAKITNAQRGPSVTRYELQPEPGVKVSRILSLSDDIALSLASAGIRFEAPIPGKSAIGIEVPNKDTDIVYLKDVLKSPEYLNASSKLSVGLGRDIAGNVVVGDITKFPHVLIAGSTGSGKSVCINTIITSILFKASPDEVKMIMIDPKVVELGIYNGLPHLLVPVVTNPKKAAAALNWAVNEVENRYAAFAEKRVRDLKGYNMSLAEGEQTMPHIVIIIDELADLMMTSSKEVEDSIIRLAQKARAAGVHLVIATQRPSVDVITGLIKANIPSRIAFAVTSYIDSRTILDAAGAEKLLGRGDMLYHPIGMIKPKRVQGAFVSDDEVENLVNEIKMTYGETEYSQEVINAMDKPAGDKAGASSGKNEEEDNADLEMIIQAGDLAVEFGQMSTSFLQRKLKLGFGRAARIIDALEERGIVSAAEGSKPRSTLISKEDWEKIKETI